jgi:Zn-dependent M32 family carboxypeptidase
MDVSSTQTTNASVIRTTEATKESKMKLLSTATNIKKLSNHERASIRKEMKDAHKAGKCPVSMAKCAESYQIALKVKYS